jgi:uncharacterized protein YrrD
MIKGKALIGHSVVAQDGTQLGAVRDLIFDHDTGHVLALVLNERDLFGLMDALIVPWREVASVGADVVFVRTAASKMKLHDDEAARTASQRETSLSGTRIVTTEGKELGTLADMIIDEATGRVLGYEISGGFIADTLHGKKFLPAPPGLEVGKDAAVVPPQAEASIKAQK